MISTFLPDDGAGVLTGREADDTFEALLGGVLGRKTVPGLPRTAKRAVLCNVTGELMFMIGQGFVAPDVLAVLSDEHKSITSTMGHRFFLVAIQFQFFCPQLA